MLPITQTLKLVVAGAGFIAVAAAATRIARRHEAAALEKIVSDGIARHAGLYDGLYEGLCQILAHEAAVDRDTLKEWCGRTARIEDESAYPAAFCKLFDSALEAPEDEYRRKLSLLLELIAKAGISRVEAKTVSFDAFARKSYIYLGEGVPDDGVVCNILKPCWTFEGRTVEQGIIVKGEM